MIRELIGESVVIRSLVREIDDIAPSDAKVLITGESGVGKDVVARRIHDRSGRQGRLVTINCAGVPESLLESELFGHVRGSFTGAFRDKRGWLDGAEDGTIFLDEVGEMSARMQAMLLRFVENGEIQRVGSERVQVVGNRRIVAATNRNLVECVADGTFREDLYYRLNVVHIVVPPLRERPDDIGLLADHFLATFAAAYQMSRPTLSVQALEMLVACSWPGNVRELSNLIERLVVRNRAPVLSADDVAAAMAAPGLGRRDSKAGPREQADVLYERMVKAGESFWTAVHTPFTSHDLTRADLRALIARGLKQTRGDYRSLLTLFNASVHDYRRFLKFLTKHNCRPSFQEFRAAARPLPPGDRAPGLRTAQSN